MLIKPQLMYDNSKVSIEERGQWGIDKISISLSSSALNHSLLESQNMQWHYAQDRNSLLYCLKTNKHLILQRLINGCYMFIITQEYFNSNNPKPYNTIVYQIKQALIILKEEGFILDNKTFNDVIQRIKEIEIYFNFRPNHIRIKDNRYFDSIEEASSCAGLYRYNGTETYYSPNGKNGSSVCLYDKKSKDIHDRFYSMDEINNFPYSMRLEFRLRDRDVEDNSKLGASLGTVFTNYLNTLAFLHNKYVKNNIEFNIPIRNKYQRVIRRSNHVTSQRNTHR